MAKKEKIDTVERAKRALEKTQTEPPKEEERKQNSKYPFIREAA